MARSQKQHRAKPSRAPGSISDGRRKFDAAARARFVGLVEAGRTMEAAAATVGVSDRTVRNWVVRGRSEDGTPAAEFAADVDAALKGAASERLSEDDVLQLLERAARKGSVTAMKALLDRFKKESRGDHEDPAGEEADPLSEFDELAEARRRRAAA